MTGALGRHDDDAGLTLSVSLGEGMEGVAWEMNTERLFFLVLQLVFTIEIRWKTMVFTKRRRNQENLRLPSLSSVSFDVPGPF